MFLHTPSVSQIDDAWQPPAKQGTGEAPFLCPTLAFQHDWGREPIGKPATPPPPHLSRSTIDANPGRWEGSCAQQSRMSAVYSAKQAHRPAGSSSGGGTASASAPLDWTKAMICRRWGWEVRSMHLMSGDVACRPCLRAEARHVSMLDTGCATRSLLVCRREAAGRCATGSQGREEWAVAGQKAAAHREDVHALKGEPPRHHLHRAQGEGGAPDGDEASSVSRSTTEQTTLERKMSAVGVCSC